MTGRARRAKGFVPDPPKVAASLAASPEPIGDIPLASSLIRYAPKHFDQGTTSSCTMHATAGALLTSFAAAGTPLPFVPSPAEGYRLARALDRATDFESGKLPKLTDDGAMPSSVMRAISRYGIYKMHGPTKDGRNSDAEPKTINDEPSLDTLESVELKIAAGEYYAISSAGPRRVRELQRAIVAKHAVCFAIFADQAFEDWDASKGHPLSRPDLNDPNGGLHYVYAIGFRTTSNRGNVIFRFRNSWGDSWGMAGDGEGDELFVAGMSDIRVMAPAARSFQKGSV